MADFIPQFAQKFEVTQTCEEAPKGFSSSKNFIRAHKWRSCVLYRYGHQWMTLPLVSPLVLLDDILNVSSIDRAAIPFSGHASALRGWRFTIAT
jgi:hypothetical protein